MSSVSRGDSSESDSAAAAAWKRKYEEQAEIVKTLGSAGQLNRYAQSSQMSRH